MQLEKMQLEEKLDAIQNPNGSADEDGNDDKNADSNSDNSTSGNNSTSAGAGKDYTVQDGDTAWTLAQKFLGNGADYKKILDANGMKESDTLKPGTKIKIPAAN